MRVSLIAVPYDLGRADVGSGRGPAAYLKAGAAETLRARGHEVEIVTVKREAPFTDELQAVLDVDEAVAVAVDEAVFGDSLPLVVAGNCNVTLGVRAGLQRAGDGDAALVWLDAHGDFNTPATTETGYLDGMPLAMLCGRAYRRGVRARARGRAARGTRDRPRRRARVRPRGARLPALVRRRPRGRRRAARPGTGRGCSPRRSTRSPRSAATSPASSRTTRRRRTCTWTSTCSTPRRRPASPSRRRTGCPAAQLLEAIDLVRERFTLVAVTVTSFTPDRDEAGTTLAAGLAVLQRVTTELARRP